MAKTLQRAKDFSLAGRLGPVHVDLPYDLMQAAASDADMPQRVVRRRFHEGSPSPSRAPGHSAGLEALAGAIDGATRPAIIAGFQLAREGPGDDAACLKFAERLNVPVFDSLAAKG
jgi:thiamine pyrophosphate-dependent acetolactate synthase large subunit-like protein